MFYRDLMPRAEYARPRPGDLLVPATRHKEAVRCDGLIAVRAGRFHLMAALRTETGTAVRLGHRQDGEGDEFLLCRLLYQLLCDETKTRPPWGVLTGVRPVRLVHELWKKGCDDAGVANYFTRRCLAAPEKAQLALTTAKIQQPLIDRLDPYSCSLYIGIPFCPSRCSYCSFVSRTIGREQALVQPYIDKLCIEVAQTVRLIRRLGLKLCTVYIGGGTPTAISADQLRQLMGTVRSEIDLSTLEEYTVEAGRPDCTDEEKLSVLLEYGATRISINPQTFSDEVLAAIGRKHTAQDILDCYAAARRIGHKNINMDLIAGLPKDTVEGFERSLKQAIALGPENITVHTLTLKRASNLVIDHARDEYEDVAAMVAKNHLLGGAGYQPYYLYRQKGTLQNLENTGFTKPGYAGLYNIYIMEELHTIFSTGAGGSTKLKQPDGTAIERIFNYKYPAEYIAGFDTILERKKRIGDFYGCNLDSETIG
ncbi:MAG TPA: coproporphyrinogen dehydrogenase HemZ [Candidatus Pygmaiobacter gallistercoris]|nr:coproporphyrinogen dehydrogenase HemZ [Candidatus Pygmaiobacter gallistercoris]